MIRAPLQKTRAQDRVAIHEAMEQQTISIAKAGITTTLNSRAGVLAAANPAFGRYDDMKSPEENIDFQSTILSRFDMIFVIQDKRDPEQDRAVTQHVLRLYKMGAAAGAQVACLFLVVLVNPWWANARAICSE